ncbi:transposase [Roseomonas xinghualingensis]|uniref:transposase n=1 Tax=Roseomonas xinghualingensis TaxID=2986475 RepID=UPI0021F1A3C2|nr:transposase [Roseomonas sp. SXEYE001]MCV4205979.1 transposase [Roseomonas sp. SXEYE001]
MLPRAPQGRRVADLRRRMDGIFWLASTPGAPWKDLPPEFGRPDTVARFFRRLTHNGLWHRLLQELARTGPKHPLRSIEYAICRATRRAARLGGMALLVLIRRLGLRTALNGPPWLLPNPLLSEMLARTPLPPAPTTRQQLESARQHLKSVEALARAALGRARIPRSVRLAWP